MINANKAYYGDIADNYERDRVVEPIWEREQDFVRDYFSRLDMGTTILDAPIGTGRFVDFFLEKNMTVMGADISADMLAKVRDKFKNNEKIKLFLGNVTSLPFPGNSIDYVICWRLVHLLNSKDLNKMISEFGRIFRKELIIQTFEPRQEKKLPLASRLIRKIRKIKNLALGKNEIKTWGDIKNFIHKKEEISEILKIHNLKIKDNFVLGKDDPLNRERIYIVCHNS
ncbi:MAG: class I SAM-dependent methyltransferase [Candidatus Paceibacterota bacterium]|jgi:ubiquinone/menaquinone biosynthesis C-methylase UbiE